MRRRVVSYCYYYVYVCVDSNEGDLKGCLFLNGFTNMVSKNNFFQVRNNKGFKNRFENMMMSGGG